MLQRELLERLNGLLRVIEDVFRAFDPDRILGNHKIGLQIQLRLRQVVELSKRLSQRDEIDRQLLQEGLGLSPIWDTEELAKIIGSQFDEDSRMDNLEGVMFNYAQATRALNDSLRIWRIFRKPEELLSPEDTITVTLLDGIYAADSAARVATLIRIVSTLYELVERVYGPGGQILRITRCDSGSEKEFDFTGFSRSVKALQEFLIGMWDRFAYRKELKIQKGAEALKEALPIIEKIKELEQAGTISPLEAQSLANRLMTGSSEFFIAGGTLPELEKAKTIATPKQLASSEQKLLPESTGENQPEKQTPPSTYIATSHIIDVAAHPNPAQKTKKKVKVLRFKRKRK